MVRMNTPANHAAIKHRQVTETTRALEGDIDPVPLMRARFSFTDCQTNKLLSHQLLVSFMTTGKLAFNAGSILFLCLSNHR